MITTAQDIKVLQRSISYKPVWVNYSHLLKDSINSTTNNAASSETGNGNYNQRPIIKLLVAKNTVTGLYLRVWAFDTAADKYADIPIEAFKTGNEYAIYLDKYEIVNSSGAIQANQDANFVLVGYLSKTIPYTY